MAAEVCAALTDAIMHNTVQKMLSILEGKRHVAHTDEGRMHRFHALVAREQAGSSAFGRLVDRMFVARRCATTAPCGCKDRTVWARGRGRDGELGLGDRLSRAVPTRLPTLTGVSQIGADGAMSWATLTNGSVVVWGKAPSATSTRDVYPPVLLHSPLPGLLADAIEVGNGIALMRDGTVRTWGGNSFGSLGTGAGADAVSVRGVRVGGLSDIVHVWSGINRRLALSESGSL